MRKFIKIFSFFLALIGAGIIVWVFFPILSYQLTAPKNMTYLSPIDDENITDYTKASSFFPEAHAESFDKKGPVSYKISIPRLGIKDAVVSMGGEDLSQSLIQYIGTATPGKNGNAVIFGHSVLPSFYDPKNYLTIFSTLPTIGKGDTITINYDGITYKYQVEKKFEVEPTDVDILTQTYDDSYISLVTCVPPGLLTRRLVVVARIVPVNSNS